MDKEHNILKFKAGEFYDKGIEKLVRDYIGDDVIGDIEDILDGFGRYLRDRGLLINTEPASPDLMKEYEYWHKEHFNGKRDISLAGEYLERKSQIDLARHFADWQKKQMIKNALDGTIEIFSTAGWWCADVVFDMTQLKRFVETKYDNGDEVKVIIIKGE